MDIDTQNHNTRSVEDAMERASERLGRKLDNDDIDQFPDAEGIYHVALHDAVCGGDCEVEWLYGDAASLVSELDALQP